MSIPGGGFLLKGGISGFSALLAPLPPTPPPTGTTSDAGEDDRLTQEEVVVQRMGKQLRILKAHDFFGEIALLNDVPRTATVVCNQPTRVLQLPKHLFSKFVSFAPSIKRALKDHLIETGQQEKGWRNDLSEALLASATNSWIDADVVRAM